MKKIISLAIVLMLAFTCVSFAETDTFVPPEEIYVEDISAFDGTWSAAKLGIDGVYTDISQLSDPEYLDDFGAFSLTVSAGAIVPEGGFKLQFELVDGLLFAEEGRNSYRVRLLEGDMFELDGTDIPFSVIYVRAE